MHLKSLISTRSLIVASMLLAPVVAKPAAIKVNSTCEIGNCAAPDSLTIGMSVPSTPLSLTYTFGNGDKFNITGSYAAVFTGATSLKFTPVATYVGSMPSVGNDVLTLDAFQNYFFPGMNISYNGVYQENVPLFLASTAGPGSTVEGQAFYDGASVGLVGPFGPGSYDMVLSKNLTNLDGNTLMADNQVVYDFTAGTGPGTVASSGVPEPAQMLPLGLGFLASAYALVRRRKA